MTLSVNNISGLMYGNQSISSGIEKSPDFIKDVNSLVNTVQQSILKNDFFTDNTPISVRFTIYPNGVVQIEKIEDQNLSNRVRVETTDIGNRIYERIHGVATQRLPSHQQNAQSQHQWEAQPIASTSQHPPQAENFFSPRKPLQSPSRLQKVVDEVQQTGTPLSFTATIATRDYQAFKSGQAKPARPTRTSSLKNSSPTLDDKSLLKQLTQLEALLANTPPLDNYSLKDWLDKLINEAEGNNKTCLNEIKSNLETSLQDAQMNESDQRLQNLKLCLYSISKENDEETFNELLVELRELVIQLYNVDILDQPDQTFNARPSGEAEIKLQQESPGLFEAFFNEINGNDAWVNDGISEASADDAEQEPGILRRTFTGIGNIFNVAGQAFEGIHGNGSIDE